MIGHRWARSPGHSSSLVEIRPKFGRDRLRVETPGHTSTQFPVPRRPLLWPGIFRKLASPYSTTRDDSSRANRVVGCVGAISPLLGAPRPFCCQRPISPISQFALAGLVYSIGTLNPIHTQPPVQNKAIVRPPETVLVTLLPSKTQSMGMRNTLGTRGAPMVSTRLGVVTRSGTPC